MPSSGLLKISHSAASLSNAPYCRSALRAFYLFRYQTSNVVPYADDSQIAEPQVKRDYDKSRPKIEIEVDPLMQGLLRTEGQPSIAVL